MSYTKDLTANYNDVTSHQHLAETVSLFGTVSDGLAAAIGRRVLFRISKKAIPSLVSTLAGYMSRGDGLRRHVPRGEERALASKWLRELADRVENGELG